jgi:YebC/PmpR family DNA-binding regulatory protein
MAGHSKWANIRFRKGAQDAKRGKLFTKLIREITVAARFGPDLESNPTLRAAVVKAKSNSMQKDSIDRAIKKGSGTDGADNYDAIRYEGYGPMGVAMLVDCLTDNRNRTVAEVRHSFSRFNGNLGAEGSVSYLFNQVGMISFDANEDEDKILELSIEAGALDIDNHADSSFDIICKQSDYESINLLLSTNEFQPVNSEVLMKPDNYVTLDQTSSETMMRLVDHLEDLDDVQSVYTNADIPEEYLAS